MSCYEMLDNCPHSHLADLEALDCGVDDLPKLAEGVHEVLLRHDVVNLFVFASLAH